MNASQYLSELAANLAQVPDPDRADALAYYAEYFADAGPEREQEVIAALGSPRQLAAEIKANVAVRDLDGAHTKTGKGINAVLLVIAGIFAAPIAIPVAIAIAAVIFSIIVSIGAVMIALFASTVAIFFSGLASVIAGFAVLPMYPASTLFYVGVGLALMGLGYLLGTGIVLLTRLIFGGIAKLFNSWRVKRREKRERKAHAPYPQPPMQPVAAGAAPAPAPAQEMGGTGNE